jgi:hypothetical protein
MNVENCAAIASSERTLYEINEYIKENYKNKYF